MMRRREAVQANNPRAPLGELIRRRAAHRTQAQHKDVTPFHGADCNLFRLKANWVRKEESSCPRAKPCDWTLDRTPPPSAPKFEAWTCAPSTMRRLLPSIAPGWIIWCCCFGAKPFPT